MTLTRNQRRQLTRLRLSSQLVTAQHIESRSPAEVVKWMVATQAQDFLAAKWAIGLRSPGTTDAEVSKAIADGNIVRSWPMRGTLHFVAPEDLGWMLELSRARMVQRAATTHAAEGLTPQVLERAREVAVETLEGGKVCTRDEMREVLSRAAIPTQGQALYHALWFLSQTATLCLGPPRAKQQTFALLNEWVSNPRRLEHDEAIGELARRYFASHGPATLHDFAWWSSSTLKDARIGLDIARKELAELVIDDTSYFLASETLEPLPPAGTQLLPSFDEFLLGYQNRDATLKPAVADKVVPGKNGMFLPIAVHGGEVIGTWKRTLAARTVTVEVSTFEPVKGRTSAAISRCAEEYAKFLGLTLRSGA